MLIDVGDEGFSGLHRRNTEETLFVWRLPRSTLTPCGHLNLLIKSMSNPVTKLISVINCQFCKAKALSAF